MVWDPIDEVARNDVIPGEGSIPGRHYCADSTRAKVVFVILAVAEIATIGTELDCSSLSNLDDCHFIVYFDDCT
jgi:hypothetical protein